MIGMKDRITREVKRAGIELPVVAELSQPLVARGQVSGRWSDGEEMSSSLPEGKFQQVQIKLSEGRSRGRALSE